LPISFDTTKEAARLNIKTRAEALNYLKDGGAVGVFPGGTVSTSSKAFEPPMDPVWRSFTAKMIGRSGATVVPIFFEGQNSRLFQMASLLHNTLRLGLYIREFKMRVDNPVKIVVGAPISAAQLTADKLDPATLMDNLRKTTYNLSPKPVQIDKFGLETEEWHRQPRAGTR
ncbi:MAG: acyltransferase, partial [Rhodobacteraceae bacterium]|nr:acyltransferase [Paracoccaceae bacterium]